MRLLQSGTACAAVYSSSLPVELIVQSARESHRRWHPNLLIGTAGFANVLPNVKYADRVRLHPNLARLPPMPYRHRDSMSRKLRAMRDARERRRLEGVEPRYPSDLPALRRTLVIIDYDFGRVEHRIDLYRTPRIDCYRAVADGVEWKRSIGWSKVLAGLRVKFPRGPCSLIFDAGVFLSLQVWFYPTENRADLARPHSRRRLRFRCLPVAVLYGGPAGSQGRDVVGPGLVGSRRREPSRIASWRLRSCSSHSFRPSGVSQSTPWFSMQRSLARCARCSLAAALSPGGFCVCATTGADTRTAKAIASTWGAFTDTRSCADRQPRWCSSMTLRSGSRTKIPCAPGPKRTGPPLSGVPAASSRSFAAMMSGHKRAKCVMPGW